MLWVDESTYLAGLPEMIEAYHGRFAHLDSLSLQDLSLDETGRAATRASWWVLLQEGRIHVGRLDCMETGQVSVGGLPQLIVGRDSHESIKTTPKVG